MAHTHNTDTTLQRTVLQEFIASHTHLEHSEQGLGEAGGLGSGPTWNTVSRAWGKLSKVLLLVWVSSKLNFPPNTCMPSREKMMIDRKSVV